MGKSAEPTWQNAGEKFREGRKVIRELLVTSSCLVFLLVYFLSELLFLARSRRRIPLRICVTGSRGKSAVTRLLASVLREAGYRVLAKTTGSKPVLIFPDGSEKDIERKGNPSILESRNMLVLGAKLGVNALVVELMSVQPECLFAESVQMMRPHILAITNVRLDHIQQWGRTKDETAGALVNALSPCCTVFIPKEECFPVFDEAGKRLKARIVRVSGDSAGKLWQTGNHRLPDEFEENLRVVSAISEFLGVGRESLCRGVSNATPDFGSLKAWAADLGSPARRFHFISAFAANDPESTLRVVSKVKERIPVEGKRVVGLLNLRRDRGDRTLQWQEALEGKDFRLFQRIFLIGGHARALEKRLRSWKGSVSVMKARSPQKITAEIIEQERGGGIVFGMGNMGGAGKELVEYWETVGRPV